MKQFSATLTMLLMAGSAFAQTTGTITYGPTALATPAGGALHAVPIPALFLLPLGIALAFLGYRGLRKQGARHLLGALLVASGLAISVGSTVHIQDAVAAAATAVELDNPNGGTVDIPDTDAIYTNTSGVSLEIGNVAPAPRCSSNTPADECVSGMELADGESCSTLYTCVPLPEVSVVKKNDGVEAATPTHGAFTLSRTGDTAATLTVKYSLEGTATVDEDYTDTNNGEIEFPVGQSQVDVAITVSDDTVYDPSEQVELTIQPDATYAVDSAAYASLEITALDKRVFLTTGSWTGNLRESDGSGGLTTGLQGADTKCAADANKPTGSAVFKALLGASGRDISNNWVLMQGAKYFRANDTSIFISTAGSSSVFTEPLHTSIGTVSRWVWTGLNASAGVANTCADWSQGTSLAARGNYAPTQFRRFNYNNNSLCTGLSALTCVEQ